MKKTMVIVANYADPGEGYGLLGPQMAATIIQENTDFECIVVAVGHDFDKEQLRDHIITLGGKDRPIIGFSNIGGRPEFWDFAHELKQEGGVTILGGPQADVDFRGEINWEKHQNRFSGVKHSFSFALHGPAEQLIPFLNSGKTQELEKIKGMHVFRGGTYQVNVRDRWRAYYLRTVNWQNLFHLGPTGLEPVTITSAQVVQQIGCPYAARSARVSIDYPTNIHGKPLQKKGAISLDLSGCSFCDVARDKGFAGNLSLDTAVTQIRNLPEDPDRRKIPFELINERPFPRLAQLLRAIIDTGITISQIDLVTRADWFIEDLDSFRNALERAQRMGVKIVLSSIGFESFSNALLRNLNKGYLVDTNLSAVTRMRQLKEEFPETFFYSSGDGAVHGFIHPTPWDSVDTEKEMNRNILMYALSTDVLPTKSTPLIIHHACALGDWIREWELRQDINLNRRGSIIEWW
jgi:hypothetical protein